MTVFLRHPASRLALLALVSAFASVATAQDDSKTFDCHVTLGDKKYDLEKLAGEYEASRSVGLPPSTIEDKLTFNLCGALSRKEAVPDDEQVRVPRTSHAARGVFALGSVVD